VTHVFPLVSRPSSASVIPPVYITYLFISPPTIHA